VQLHADPPPRNVSSVNSDIILVPDFGVTVSNRNTNSAFAPILAVQIKVSLICILYSDIITLA